MIHFGTSGWRGVVGQDFTFRNVRLAMESAAAVLQRRGETGEIVVSYDTRLLSEKFAREAAGVFTHYGFPVVVSERDLPSPCIAFAARERNAVLGVVFTASHNPADYNGVKLYTREGTAAQRELTDEIEAEAARRDAAFSDFFVPQRSLLRSDPLTDGYLAALEGGFDWDAIAASGLTVVVDPLFGTAREFLDRMLIAHGVTTHVIHGVKDPYFGGYSPECTPHNLAGLREKVRTTGASLGLATDGDADRFGVIDSACRALTSNLVIALLLEYLLSHRRITGGIGRTVGTSRLVDRVAKAHGCEVIETLVGFHYFGPMMVDGRVAIATEESAGLGVAAHLPERDGIYAALLMVEMLAVERRSLDELVRALFHRYGTLVSRRVQLPLRERTKVAIERVADMQLSEFAGQRVERADRRDGLLLEMSDGSWVLIRPAKTEPKLRIYAEATSSQQLLILVREARRLVHQAEEEVPLVRN
jgi:phosphoglucomutase